MSATLLAASFDDSRLAYIHGGRLVLCDSRALTELVATDAPEGARQLAFIGPPWRLLIATEDELFTYELAGLTVLGRRTVASGARVAAVIENRAVLLLPAGPSIALARFLDDAIDVHALDTSAPPLDIAPLEQQQALVVTTLRNEVVDLISRRVVARLHLGLPPAPRLLGQSGGLRFLWTAAVGGRALTIIRLSDGRATTLELPGPIRQVLAASTSSWVVVQTDDGLLRVHVVTLAMHRIEADLSRAACVGGAADAGLYWIDDGWRLRRTSLAGDAVVASGGGPLRLSFAALDEGKPPPPPVSVAITPPGVSRSGQPLAPSTPGGASPAPAVVSTARDAAAALADEAPPLPAPVVEAAPAPALAAAPAPAVDAEPASAPAVDAAPPSAPAVDAAPAPMLAQLEPSAPTPMAPRVDAAPMFVDPPPVSAGSWNAPLIPTEALASAPPPSPPSRGSTPAASSPVLAPIAADRAPAPAPPAPPAPAPSAPTASAAPSPASASRAPASASPIYEPPTSVPAPRAASGASTIYEPPGRAPTPIARVGVPAPAPAARPAAPAGATPSFPDLPDERTAGAGLTADARPLRSWRMQCAAWARQLLRGKDQAEPSFAGTPLALLAKRAHLDPDGARALALLYGAWLLGRPARPLARLARAVTWDELAGRGSLPEAGLHTVRSGRAAIRPTVARFLDGARARRLTVHGLRPRSNLSPGRQLVKCLTDVPLHTAAQAVADHLGAGAIIDERGARGRRQLAVAIDEAWLRAVPAVVIPGADLDASAIAAARLRRDHLLIVLWPDSVVPVPLEEFAILAL